MADVPVQGKNYTVQKDDTLIKIATVAYGNGAQWQKIAAANGIPAKDGDLIFPGQVLYIPPDEEKKTAETAARINRFAGRKKEQITLVIGGGSKKLETRELPVKSGRFAYGIDILASSYNAEIAWTPGKDKWLDDTTARGSFAESELYIGSELVCTARLYARKNTIARDGMTKSLEFYSVTKDLVDSDIPPAFSEIRNSDLKGIAEKLLATHGYPVTFKDPPGPAFDVIERNDKETVAKYVQRLAAQRGLFVSCDEKGGVVFQKAANSGRPVAHIVYPGRTAVSHEAHFDDAKRYAKYFASSISGDGTALNATASDPQVPAARQILFEANDSDAGNIQSAAEWAMLRRELEALSVIFPVSDWFDDSGDLWKPNAIVTAKSPVLDIPEQAEFVIRQAEFCWSAAGRSATLNLVPPLSVNGSGKLVIGTK
jgi:prophage tail gpP-like protein